MLLSKLFSCALIAFVCCSTFAQADQPKYEVIELSKSEVIDKLLNDNGHVVFCRKGSTYLYTPQNGVEKIKEIPQMDNVRLFQFSNSGIIAGMYSDDPDAIDKPFIYHPKKGLINLGKLIEQSFGNALDIKIHALNDQGNVVFSFYSEADGTNIERFSIYVFGKGMSVLAEIDHEKKYSEIQWYKFASLNNKNQVLLRNDESVSKFLLCEPGKKNKNLGDLGLSKLLENIPTEQVVNYLKISAKSCTLNDQGYITGHLYGFLKSDNEYECSTFIYYPDGKLYVSGLTEFIDKGTKLLTKHGFPDERNPLLFSFNPLLDNKNRGVFFRCGQNREYVRGFDRMITWPIHQWSEKGALKKINRPKFSSKDNFAVSVHCAALNEAGQVQMFGRDRDFKLPEKYENEASFYIWNEKDGVNYFYNILSEADFTKLDRHYMGHDYTQINVKGDILLGENNLLLLHKIN